MTRRFLIASLMVVAVAACGVTAEDDPRLESDDDVPFDLLDPPSTTTTPNPGAAGSRIRLCFIHDGKLRTVERSSRPDADLDEVVEVLMAGPTPAETTAGLTSTLAEEVAGGPIDATRGVAKVDLTTAFTAQGGDRQLLAVAQLVCTLTSRPGIGQVTFTLDGEPVDVPRGDGSTTSNPVARDDYQQLEETATP